MSALAVVAVALAAAAPVHTQTASSGAVYATVSSVQLPDHRWYTRLVVDRDGRRALDSQVRPYSMAYPVNQPVGTFGQGARTIVVRDLDGDGEPEILLDFWIGGAHCCLWTRVYRWDEGGRTYESSTHWWGDPAYRIERLGGQTAFVTYDDRFAYAFASFAGSGMPVRIWSYRGGRFIDITAHEPSLVRRDATFWWRWYGKARRGKGETSGILAAWAADECRLGRGAHAVAWIDAHSYVLTPWEYAGTPAPFVKRLREFLRRRGYDC